MMKHYRSEHSNQVHQLNVSVSKHLYVTKTGFLRHQKKPMETSLKTLGRSGREHVVYYLVRDHLSGCFYGEVCGSSELIPIAEFLHRAWSEKDGYAFQGLPDLLVLPETVRGGFPGMAGLLDALGIQRVKATSGFQAGVRDVRSLEEAIRYLDARQGGVDLKDVTFAEVGSLVPGECAALAEQPSRIGRHVSKIDLWRNGVRSLRPAPSGDAFQSAYRA